MNEQQIGNGGRKRMRITLATLHKFTAQEVVDQVWKHLIDQDEQSYYKGIPLYRGPEGLMCAVGCLIADDEYENWMDNIDYPMGWRELSDEIGVSAHKELIVELQEVHDSDCYPDNPKDWKELFKNVVDDFGLKMPEYDGENV